MVMAKKRAGRGSDGVNKSAAIREVFDLHGLGVKSKDVISALAARGITVSSAHVANERSRLMLKQKKGGDGAVSAASAARRGRKPGRKPGRRPGRRPGRKPGVAAAPLSRMENTLLEAKRLADLVGGIGEARRALDLLAKLQG
jgi:hypothetical protein